MQGNADIPFRDLVARHQDKVFSTAISFLQNHHDAEDVSQEVFIEIYRSLESFRQQSSVSTWIYRITVNKCLDHLRKKNRHKRFGFLSTLFHSESGEPLHEPKDFEHPGIKLENKEKSVYLFKALETLPGNQKTAFILFTMEELSQKEVGDIMKLSPKAVESLIQRAKVNLRKKLENIYEGRRK